MSFDLPSFRKAIIDAAPAPHNETPSYEKFSSVFAWLTLFLTITLAYAFTVVLLPDYQTLAAAFQKFLPMMNGRVAFLNSHDYYSAAAYIATVLCGAITLPIILAVNCAYYFKLVVLPGRARAVNWRTLVSVLPLISLFSFLVWIAFFSVPRGFEASRPGFSVILFWPIFPALGAGIIFLVEVVIFSSLVGALKLIFGKVSKNG